MRYAKFGVAVITAGAIVLGAALTDDKVTNAEWVAVVIAILGAVGVWAVPNKPATPPPVGETTERLIVG